MAGYARQVYEDYGVLMFWENESVNENLKKYIQANIELGDVEHKGSNPVSYTHLGCGINYNLVDLQL